MLRRGLATAAQAQPGAWPGAGRMAAWRAHAYCEDGALGDQAAAAALRLEAARRPARRAPGDVLVRVHAASINPIDLAIVRGYGASVLNTLRRLTGASDVEFPLVPGRDFVGTVAGAAPGAALAPGARVWGVVPPHRAGAHAQYVVVDSSCVGAAPESLDELSAGGALYAALSACAVLRAAGLEPGGGAGGARRRVLLLGLGGVGHAALQLLVHDGHQVVVGCAGELAAAARALGAEPLDRGRDDYRDRLRQEGPFDAVLDCAGQGGASAAALPCAFRVYATLSSPLLRRADALGLAPGVLAAAAELLRDNLTLPAAPAAPAAPEPLALAPRVRWAFFSPRAQDIEMLRRRADRGRPAPRWPRGRDAAPRAQFSVQVEGAWGWRDAAAAYRRAAAGHARGKLLIDFTAP